MFDIHSTTYYPFSSAACLRNDDLHHQPPLPIHLPRLQRNGTTTMTTGGSREGGPLCLWFVLFISVTLFLILNILQQKTCHDSVLAINEAEMEKERVDSSSCYFLLHATRWLSSHIGGDEGDIAPCRAVFYSSKTPSTACSLP